MRMKFEIPVVASGLGRRLLQYKNRSPSRVATIRIGSSFSTCSTREATWSKYGSLATERPHHFRVSNSTPTLPDGDSVGCVGSVRLSTISAGDRPNEERNSRYFVPP